MAGGKNLKSLKLECSCQGCVMVVTENHVHVDIQEFTVFG